MSNLFSDQTDGLSLFSESKLVWFCFKKTADLNNYRIMKRKVTIFFKVT